MTISLKRPVLTASALLVFLLMSASVIFAEGKTGDLPLIRSEKDAVARVDGEDITEENLRIAVNNVLPMQSFHTSVTDRRYKAIRKETLEKLITNIIIYNDAVAKNVKGIGDKEFKERLEALKKKLAPGDSLEKVLKRSNLTIEGLRKAINFTFVVERESEKARKKLKKEAEALVTVKYMREYYNKNLNKFMVPAQLHLRGILVKVEPSASQRVWNKARKDILALSKKIKDGADFAAIAKKHSKAADASKGGDMGWAHVGSLLPDVESAVSSLKVGEISAPVLSIYGVHLFRLEGKRPAKQIKFSELNQKKLRSELQSKEYNRLTNSWVDGLRKKAKVEYLRKI